MKKGDWAVIFSIIIVAAGIFYITTRPPSSGDEKVVSIQSEGKEIRRIPLRDVESPMEIRIENRWGENLILVDPQGAMILEADCPDGYCVESGKISSPGETIVCLPHRVIVEIVGEKPGADDLDILLK